MKKHRAFVTAAALAAALAGCSDVPTNSDEQFDGELVITEGLEAPAPAARNRPAFSAAAAAASLGGAVSTPVSLKPQSCDAGQTILVTYTVTGRQDNPASFKVNTTWTYNGAAWTGSVPVTVNVAPRATGPGSDLYPVSVTLVNASTASSGTSSFTITPSDLVTSAPAALGMGDASVTMHIAFTACPVTNTPPTLVLPSNVTVEATSSAGAAATFTVTASDAQDGDLTSSVACAPTSGSTFPLGTTTVNCSVTDAGGLTASGSFDVKVEDTTAPVFTAFPSGTVNLIAADINGAVLDVPGLGIAVADVGGVSEPSTYACDYVAGTALAIGSTTDVDCTATDAAGNESAVSTFEVFVGLNVGTTGFLAPLRMADPFSAHKRGSTIPHKFLPPAYADGTLATDLAAGLKLTVRRIDAVPDADGIEANDFAAGSTAWRYDAASGHYIFNLKTGTATPWDIGTWSTVVAYAGIPLAATQFELRR
jgi:hypothetical protein